MIFELQCSQALQKAHTTLFLYTIDWVRFWMRYSHYSVLFSAICFLSLIVVSFLSLDLR